VFERFHAQHEQFYGYRIADEVIELIHFAVSVSGPVPPTRLPELAELPPPRPRSERPVFFRSAGYLPTPIHRRAELGRDAVVSGPAIVEEEDSTTLVPPGARLSANPSGVLVLTWGGE
jgi:N-methylhydantoinase A